MQGFRFKQFVISHARCGMKVTTDGILLGAWAPVDGCCRVLDAGTGSGLVALMLAQRSRDNCRIVALDIDEQAANQARENVAASPWPAKVMVIHRALQSYQPEEDFDLIVCNPPYYPPGPAIADGKRALARQARHLPLASLARFAAAHLRDGGCLAIILPWQQYPAWQQFEQAGLHLADHLAVLPRPGKKVNRHLLLWRKEKVDNPLCRLLWIHDDSGSYSDDYRRLCRAFYLAF